MKKRSLITALALTALCAGMMTAVIAEPGYISVSGSVTKEVEPNVASMSFSIETEAKTPEEASDKNKEIANALLDAIKAELNPETDMIKTSNFSVAPEYQWEGSKKHLKHYKAVNSLIVVVHDTQKTGKIMDIALKNGATRVDSLVMSLDNTNKYCAKLLAEAASETKVKAYTVAKALGTSISGIKSINTSCSASNTNPRFRHAEYAAMKSAGASNDSAESVPVEQGKLKIFATVNADYNLK